MLHSPGPADIARAVDEINWSAYAVAPSAASYRPDRVPTAFGVLLAADSQEAGWTAYNDVLFAVGNNHAGTLYPAAAPAAPLVVRVARECGGWARWAALEILIEFLSFDVHPDEFVDPLGATVCTRSEILAAVERMRADLVRLADGYEGDQTRASAAELLECLDEESSAS